MSLDVLSDGERDVEVADRAVSLVRKSFEHYRSIYEPNAQQELLLLVQGLGANAQEAVR